jgi:rhodanese-related sulfurtransferase
MSQNHNQISLSPVDLANAPDGWVVIDVRKPAALLASGLTMPGAVWRHPFDAANWADVYRGMRVAMYCVHGHEVSQAVRGFLAEMDIEAVIVEGGFEAWKAAGLPVAPVESADV